MKIIETLETPITQHCDVLVCGGGFAGIAAALAAARMGKQVLLLEKQYILGGLGTAGLITFYLPLCDGCGKQVSFGIAEELLRLAADSAAEAGYPHNWLDENDSSHRTIADNRFELRYNPHTFALLVEQLLLNEGIHILYGTYAVGVHCENRQIQAVITENKSGRQAIAVGSVIDATGDCDIAHFANAPTETFKQGNVLAGWYYSLCESDYQLNIVGYAEKRENQKSEKERQESKLRERFLGLNGEELSLMVQKSHAMTLKDLNAKRRHNNAFVPTSLASIPQIRMTRKIVGEYCLDDTEMHTFFSDSIGMVSDWRRRGPIYEVPFSTLYSKSVKNLVVAGRCTSVTESMWDIMRVIPCCAVTGQAAGTAAAMTTDFQTLDIHLLQTKLQSNGVVLHEQDLPIT